MRLIDSRATHYARYLQGIYFTDMDSCSSLKGMMVFTP